MTVLALKRNYVPYYKCSTGHDIKYKEEIKQKVIEVIPALAVAGAGVGAAVGGPVGAAIGGLVGAAVGSILYFFS